MAWRLYPYHSSCDVDMFLFIFLNLLELKKNFQIVKIWQIVAMKYKNEFKFTICAVV